MDNIERLTEKAISEIKAGMCGWHFIRENIVDAISEGLINGDRINLGFRNGADLIAVVVNDTVEMWHNDTKTATLQAEQVTSEMREAMLVKKGIARSKK